MEPRYNDPADQAAYEAQLRAEAAKRELLTIETARAARNTREQLASAHDIKWETADPEQPPVIVDLADTPAAVTSPRDQYRESQGDPTVNHYGLAGVIGLGNEGELLGIVKAEIPNKDGDIDEGVVIVKFGIPSSLGGVRHGDPYNPRAEGHKAEVLAFLRPGRELAVGRELQGLSDSVSREHAYITYGDGGHVGVSDPGSMNGTFVGMPRERGDSEAKAFSSLDPNIWVPRQNDVAVARRKADVGTLSSVR